MVCVVNDFATCNAVASELYNAISDMSHVHHISQYRTFEHVAGYDLRDQIYRQLPHGTWSSTPLCNDDSHTLTALLARA